MVFAGHRSKGDHAARIGIPYNRHYRICGEEGKILIQLELLRTLGKLFFEGFREISSYSIVIMVSEICGIETVPPTLIGVATDIYSDICDVSYSVLRILHYQQKMRRSSCILDATKHNILRYPSFGPREVKTI